MKTLMALALLLLCPMAMNAKQQMAKVYMFGLAASFNDSTVYITDIQAVDSAWIDTNSKFLLSRQDYSGQLRAYLDGIGELHRTCITTFALNEKDIKKKYDALAKKYTDDKKTKFKVKRLTADQFSYKPVTPYEVEESLNAAEEKAAKKAEKKKNKGKRGLKPTR